MEDRKIVIETYVNKCPDRIDCAAGHRVNVLPGGRVIQGDKIPDDVRAALSAGGMKFSEDAVWIPDGLEV